MNVYILRHIHEFNDGNEDDKLIGIYALRDEAQAAIERLVEKPGFRYQPNGFQILSYEIGRDNWSQGYPVLKSIYIRNLSPTGDKYVCVSAVAHPHDVYEIISDTPHGLEFKVGECVKCEKFRLKPGTRDLLAVEKANLD